MNKCCCPYCNKAFKTWKSVKGHTSYCSERTGDYFIDSNEGPIHFSEIQGLNSREIRSMYPNLKSSLRDIRVSFVRRGFNLDTTVIRYTDEQLLNFIRNFVTEQGRIPFYKEFENIDKNKHPGARTYPRRFRSWNNAIELAGFTPNIQDGYGTRIEALDGHLYRSVYETNFVNKFLYNKYEYIIEPRYPAPHNKYYDWSIPELDLYIELDGGCRPEIMKEKVKINKELNRTLLVVEPKDIESFNDLTKIMEENLVYTID